MQVDHPASYSRRTSDELGGKPPEARLQCGRCADSRPQGATLSASASQGEDALRRGIDSTEARIVADGYRGYDPYDALSSPLFRLPVLRTNKLVRLAAQQALKRLPVNVRPLLGIRKGYNPVTLALALQAYAYLAEARPDDAERYRAAADGLVAELTRLSSPGYSGACWGYDFDWQTRFDHFPAFTPTIVATSFVTNALIAAHEALGIGEALPLCVSAVEFVTHDLNRIPGPDGTFCWSYSPLDHQPVLNATAKGARLCAQVASLADRPELLQTAHASLGFVAANQLPSGAWPYAADDPRSWSDNFHTGYVLDSLHEYQARTGDTSFADTTERGWRYYRDNFFDDDTVPALLRPRPLSGRRDGGRAVTADAVPLRRRRDRAQRRALDARPPAAPGWCVRVPAASALRESHSVHALVDRLDVLRPGPPRARGARMKVWIDIDNPPQVQYLLPFAGAFTAAGHTAVVTARDYGITLQLLRERGVEHHVVGGEAGAGRARKATAALRRARALTRLFTRDTRPDLVVTASRAAALAGRRFGKPVFTFIDYEHVDLTVPRRTGSYVVFPDAIGAEVFVQKGFSRNRLIGYAGLKESITFADVELDAIVPFDFAGAAAGTPRLLFRPPAERAHYYDPASGDLAGALLERLAARADVQLVLTPRYAHQARYVDAYDWAQQPIVLHDPVPFVSLLAAVDAVMSSGGTMLREAAYLGIPAYSIFRSELGAVDRYLEAAGRLHLVQHATDLDPIVFAPAGPLAPAFPRGRELVAHLVAEMVERS